VLTQLLLAAGLVCAAVYFTRGQLRTAFDAALHGRAMSVAALVRYSEEPHPKLIFDDELLPPSLQREGFDLYRILGPGNRTIAQSPNWPAGFEPAAKPGKDYWNLSFQSRPYRALRLNNLPVLDREDEDEDTEPAENATLTVFYAAPTRELREAVWRAGVLTGAASLLIFALATAITVWSIRRGLAPLSGLAASAAGVSPANWELHLPPESASTAELAPLTEAMTAMLAGLRQAFTSQREFLANAAHELKTPAAILKSTLQSLAQKPRSSEEYRQGIDAALQDLARLERLLHSMLRLARAEQWARDGLRRDLAEVDLSTTCELAIERLRPLAQGRGITLELRRDGAPTLPADPDDLELVWTNLLENAIHYSPSGATVSLIVGRNGQYAEVSVEDCGPGIAAGDLPFIFDRFYRADTSRARATGGYGLGLAVSKAIVEAYGGSIHADSQTGKGTTMAVRLPIS
jgi:two-component system OmpR family sensor kinase